MIGVKNYISMYDFIDLDLSYDRVAQEVNWASRQKSTRYLGNVLNFSLLCDC